MSGRVRRRAMWALAAGVAAIAAIVSYSHIYDLGRAHGGTGVPARLLPLSVDMLILVGELMLLHEADAKGQRFTLGWVLVWSGILATLAANVAYGAQFGWLGALIWGWPAYSFILAAGGMVAVVKRGEDAGAAGHGAPALPAVPAPDPEVTPEVTSPGSPVPALEAAPEVTPETPLHAVPEVTRERSRERPSATSGKQSGPVTPERLQEHYADDLAAGQVPSIRQIKREWPVGYDRATELHDHLTAVIETAS
jgi:hypothetical protein